MKLPVIESREAIPLRFLPFITGFKLSPDALVLLLAHKQGLKWPVFNDEDMLYAYHVNFEGKPVKILPKEWDTAATDMKNIENKNRHMEAFENENYLSWRLEAIQRLPGEVFVWRDEFECVYQASFNRNILTLSGPERDGSRELNFSPMINDQFLPLVLDSFTNLIAPKREDVVLKSDGEDSDGLSPVTDTTIKTNSKEIQSLLKLVIAMAIDGYGYDPKQKKSPTPQEIAEQVEHLGLSINVDTARKWLKKSAELLPSDWQLTD